MKCVFALGIYNPCLLSDVVCASAYGYIKMSTCAGMNCFHMAQDEVNWRDF
jgi:hypothetical protein